MRAAAAAAVAALVALGVAQGLPALADNPPAPCPSPSAASSARTCTDPSQYQALQSRLGADVQNALATQRKLTQALNDAAATEITLSGELSAEEARVTDLQNQITALDQQIATLTSKIDAERHQVSALARAMYQRPATLLDLLASSGSVSDMLSQGVDMLIAGQRAHALEDQLKSDLDQAQTDRDARQSDLDQETATMQQVQAGLAQLSGVQTELDSLSTQLVVLLRHIRAAAANVNEVPPDVSAQLADLLETQETNLAAQEEAAAWAQASVGAGQQAMADDMLPTGVGPADGGIPMAWPMRGGVVTQPFGPTSFVLEPPLGAYPHFHTGIDIAAPLGTPVDAAAAGIVIVVAHTSAGYGNYVIVAHGYGVLTLYGHLLETDAYPGEAVTQGQMIGREGMTGFATGPHVHFEVRINGQFVNPARFLPPV
jgi:murein DD-endopeptidase MepM/ murein hydrolase activator NlpD